LTAVIGDMGPCIASLLGIGELGSAAIDFGTGLYDYAQALKDANAAAQAGDVIGVFAGICNTYKAGIQIFKGALDAANVANPIKEGADAFGCLTGALSLAMDIGCSDGAKACAASQGFDIETSCSQFENTMLALSTLQTVAESVSSGEIGVDLLSAGMDVVCNLIESAGANGGPQRAGIARALTPEFKAEFGTAVTNALAEIEEVQAELAALTTMIEGINSSLPAFDAFRSRLFTTMGGFGGGWAAVVGGGTTNLLSLGASGVFNLPPLQPDTLYHLEAYTRDIGGVFGQADFLSSPAGAETPFPVLKLKLEQQMPASATQDTDDDLIPDSVEWLAGTDPANPDTDGDARKDGVDSNPLFPTRLQLYGLSQPPPGFTNIYGVNWLFSVDDCTSEGSHVFGGMGYDGMVVYEWNPKGQLDFAALFNIRELGLPIVGLAPRLSTVDVEDGVLVATSSRDLWFIDVSNPREPKLLSHQYHDSGALGRPVLRNGYAYVISTVSNNETRLKVFRAPTGELVEERVAESWDRRFYSVQADEHHVYVVSAAVIFPDLSDPYLVRRLRVFTSAATGLQEISSTDHRLQTTLLSVHVYEAKLVGDRLYVGTFRGWEAYDVTDPGGPRQLVTPLNEPSVFSLDHDGASTLLTFTPFSSGQALTLYDTADETDTTRFLESLAMSPVATRLVPHDGFVLIPTASRVIQQRFRLHGGINVVRYTVPDRAGIAPTVTLIPPTDEIPGAPGIDVTGGQTLTLRVNAQDDILVRHVDLLVNGEVVASAYRYPFKPRWKVPTTPGIVTVQARALDSGGNTAVTAPITVKIY
jgi:Bacterial Ig domain